MKNNPWLRIAFSVYLITITHFYVMGQQSPEIGRWMSINLDGDTVFYEFTPEGKYVFNMVGKRLVPIDDRHNPSAKPTSMFTHRYQVNYLTTPPSIDFFDEHNQIIIKGIIEFTPEGNMKICIDRFGVNRPNKFEFSKNPDASLLIRVPPDTH